MQPSSCARRRAFGEASGVWDIDLWEQHGVLSPLMQRQLRGWPSTTLFWCDKCYENITNWLNVGDHVRSKQHRHAMAIAAESSKVLELAIEHASEPREDVNVARWASPLLHAETDKVRAASSEPLGGVNSILRHAGGARFDDRLDRTWKPAGWCTQEEERRARAGSWWLTRSTPSPPAASGAEAFQNAENSSWPSTDAFPRTTAEMYNAIPEFASSTKNYPAEQHPDERRVILIGIAGASGVGKSALAKMLAKKLQPHTQIMHADSCFYHAHQRRARTDGRSLDWESPDAVDFTFFFFIKKTAPRARR